MNWSLALSGVVLCCLQLLTAGITTPLKGTDYTLSFNHEYIFDKCDSHPENFITDAFDLSDLKYEILADDTIRLKGTIKFIMDLPPNHKILLEAQVFKKTKGEWVGTMYNMRRVDTCFALFNPAEVWQPIIKVIAPELRPCPPKEGTIFNVNVIANPTARGIQNRHADGEYKLNCRMVYGPKPNDFICFDLHFHADRVEAK